MKGMICVLGASGAVGKAASLELIKRGYIVRLLCRKEPEEVMKSYKESGLSDEDAGRIEIFSGELKKSCDNEAWIDDFFEGADALIGGVGPSVYYSHIMLEMAEKRRIPYLDPGGMHLIREYEESEPFDSLSVVGAGVFPGLSGWMTLYSRRLFVNKYGAVTDNGRAETCVGGIYTFSKAAAIDFAEEAKDSKAGIPMACIRKGEISPIQRITSEYKPAVLDGFSFIPYLSEEFIYLGKNKEIKNLDSFTVVDNALRQIMLMGQPDSKQLTELKYSEEKCIITTAFYDAGKSVELCFEAADPGTVTGTVLALSADILVKNEDICKERKGIYPLCDVMENRPIIDEIEKTMQGYMSFSIKYKD